VRWAWLLAAFLWLGFVVGLVGPLLMELLDDRGFTGRVLGLPALVTEVLVIGLAALIPVALLWRRARRHREPAG
jgi:H+/Cl- antiporter ClcA